MAFPTTSLAMRYEAKSESAYIDNDPVTSITDQSGVGRHLATGDAPTYKTAILNGHAVYRFDGVNDNKFRSSNVGSNTAWSCSIVVAAAAEGSSRSWPFTVYATTLAIAGFTEGATASEWGVFLRTRLTGGGTTQLFTSGVDTTQFTHLLFVWDGVDLILYQDGTQVATAARGGTFDPAGLTEIEMGSLQDIAGEEFGGDIALAAAWSKALDSTERDDLDSYIATTYGIGITPVGKSLSLVWDTLGPEIPVGRTETGQWASATLTETGERVFDPITESGLLVFGLAGTTPVGKSVSAQWDTRAAVGEAEQLVWDALAVVGEAEALVWDVHTTVGESEQALWDVSTTVGESEQLVWDVLATGSVGENLGLLWDVSGLSGDDLTTRWDVFSTIGETESLPWDVLVSIGESEQVLWDVAGVVGESETVLWDVEGPIGESLNLLWDVKVQVLDLRGEGTSAGAGAGGSTERVRSDGASEGAGSSGTTASPDSLGQTI